MVLKERSVEPALPHLRETRSLDSLKQAISSFIRRYDAGEYQRALGPTFEVELPEKTVLKARPLRSFRNEDWYVELSPEKQVEAEVDLARHIHREVRRIYPRVVGEFLSNSTTFDRVERSRRFKTKFGHLLGNPKSDEVDCIAHTQIFTRVASVVGFEVGVIDIPGHLVGVVKAGHNLLVSDILYPNLVDFNTWEKSIEADPDFRQIPAGKRLRDIIQPQPIRMTYEAADAKAHDSLAILLCEGRKLNGASVEEEKAIELDPGSSIIHRNHATTLYEMGNLEDAEKHYVLALKLNPKHVDAHVAYAILLGRRRQDDDLDKARAHYLKALDLDPSNAYTHLNYGSYLGNQHDLDGAEKHFQIANEIDPNLPDLQKNLKILREIKGQEE